MRWGCGPRSRARRASGTSGCCGKRQAGRGRKRRERRKRGKGRRRLFGTVDLVRLRGGEGRSKRVRVHRFFEVQVLLPFGIIFTIGSCLHELSNFKVMNFPSEPTFRLQKRTTREQAIRWSTLSAYPLHPLRTSVYMPKSDYLNSSSCNFLWKERAEGGEEGEGWVIVKISALADSLIVFSKRARDFCKGHPFPKIDKSSTGILVKLFGGCREKKTALTALLDNLWLRK